ncbi:hypothetical protein MRX96_000536 [Rhipicephalus microplus]
MPAGGFSLALRFFLRILLLWCREACVYGSVVGGRRATSDLLLLRTPRGEPIWMARERKAMPSLSPGDGEGHTPGPLGALDQRQLSLEERVFGHSAWRWDDSKLLTTALARLRNNAGALCRNRMLRHGTTLKPVEFDAV